VISIILATNVPQTAFAKAATDSIYKDSILQYSTAQLFLLVSEMFQLTTASHLMCRAKHGQYSSQRRVNGTASRTTKPGENSKKFYPSQHTDHDTYSDIISCNQF
jgi:hypothetical protein